MKKRAVGTALLVIACVVLAVALVLLFFFLYRYTNGLSGSFKTFYLRYGGEEIMTSDEREIDLEGGKIYYFETVYTLDSSSEEDAKPYSVKIVLSPDVEFEYSVDGALRLSGSTEIDLTQAFHLQKGKKFFSFGIQGNETLASLLAVYYEGHEVTAPLASEIGEKYLYRLIVTSYDKKTTYRLNLSIPGDVL